MSAKPSRLAGLPESRPRSHRGLRPVGVPNSRASWLACATLIWLAELAGPAGALEVTAITLFACDGQGSLDATHRFNTGPVDGAWDLFVYRGEAFDPGRDDPRKIEWLNRADDHTVRLPLQMGKNTFTFHHDGAGIAGVYGMNLFFDGRNDQPEISLKAEIDRDGSPYPEFTANAAAVTMGWPLTDVPGAGTLSRDGVKAGLWTHPGSEAGARATVTAFHLSAPGVKGVDLVGPHEMAPSGQGDFVGQLTMEVSEITVRPPEILLWLEKTAGITALGGGLSEKWKAAAEAEKVEPPFSFLLGGRSSRGILDASKPSARRRPLDGNRTAHSVTWLDAETGLKVRWEAVEYKDFSTVEWTIHLENTGSRDTPILSEIRALDLRLERRSRGEFLLRHHVGSPATKDDFKPLQTVLEPGAKKELSGAGGRPATRTGLTSTSSTEAKA